MNQVQTLQLSTIRLKHPQTQSQIVGTLVVENTLGNREARLRTDIVHILGVLVPVDIELDTVSRGRGGGVPEVKVQRNIPALLDVQIEVCTVKLDSRGRQAVEGAVGYPALGRRLGLVESLALGVYAVIIAMLLSALVANVSDRAG